MIIRNIFSYLLAIAASIGVITLKLSFSDVLGPTVPFLVVNSALILSAVIGGLGPGLLSLFLTGGLIYYFFLTPIDSLTISPASAIQLACYALEGLFLLWMIERHRRARQKERTLREQFETTLASIGDGVIATDRLGNITYMNGIACDLTGWDHKKALGQNLAGVFKIMDGDTKQTIINPVEKVIKEGQIVHIADSTILYTAYGSEIPIDDSAGPIYNKKGQIVGVVIVFRDITERKALEEQRDLLMGVASHEIKNNITGMKGFVQILGKALSQQENSTSVDLVTKVDNKINVLTRIINNMMDVTKIKVGMMDVKREEFDLNKLVNDTISELQMSAKQHSLTMESSLEHKVSADKVRIGQVLTNLISNAIKYSPNSDKIIIKVEQNKDKALVKVIDFGLGISPEKQEHVFEPYYRAVDKKERQAISGAGLGLYISSEIVNQIGGKMWLESTEGKGTTFYFTLPLAKKVVEDQPQIDSTLERIRYWINKIWKVRTVHK